jgi:penicillin-binding protein 2
MIDELKLLTDQRPAVSPPSDEVRAAALVQLERAIVRERAPRSRRGRVPAVLRLGWLAPALAVVATVVIAGGAILLLHHRAPARSSSAAGARGLGLVVARNGTLLAVTRVIPSHRNVLSGRVIPRRYIRGYPRGRFSVVTGAESEYDSQLRSGDTLRLSLDARLQQTGQVALLRTMLDNRADGGAFVALDPEDGQVLAMGSSQNGPAPRVDQAVQAAGPTGSVFTPITAVAALESGEWTVGDTYDDTGQYCIASTTDCLHNSTHAADGVLDLVSAIRLADGVFFYNLGARTNVNVPEGGPLQRWARAFGIGHATGIDLPGELSGTLPTPASRAVRNPWSIADNINLAVGQGDVQVTPLQVAVAYAALANGGTIVTPHVGEEIQSAQGTVLQRIDPPPRRRLHINPAFRRTILEGLRAAASEPGGTSADVFGDFPEQVYGTTGTAQYISGGLEQDYAWYAGFVPATATSKPIVVVVWVQRGGFGDVAAAPVARQLLSQWFLGRPGPWRRGRSPTL